MINTFIKLVASIKELCGLSSKNIEQITALQYKTFQDNAKIGLYVLDTANEIKDFDSFKTYLVNQIAVTQYVRDNFVVDAQEIAELDKSYFTNAAKSLRTLYLNKTSLS
jgi:phasin family protein